MREAVRVAQRSVRVRPAEPAEIPASGSPEPAADIRDVLDRLSPEHRAILVLREIEGLDEKGRRAAAAHLAGRREVAAEPGQERFPQSVVVMTANWPVAQIDEVRRMRVLAASIPGASYAEEHFDVSFDRVGEYIGDMERSTPALVRLFRSFRILESEGGQLKARAVGRVGNHGTFDVVLRPGWCLMQDRLTVGGLAAVREGEGTRVAACGGPRVPGGKVIGLLHGGDRGARRILRRLRSNLA